jgi:hypothetical protein
MGVTGRIMSFVAAPMFGYKKDIFSSGTALHLIKVSGLFL